MIPLRNADTCYTNSQECESNLRNMTIQWLVAVSKWLGTRSKPPASHLSQGSCGQHSFRTLWNAGTLHRHLDRTFLALAPEIWSEKQVAFVIFGHLYVLGVGEGGWGWGYRVFTQDYPANNAGFMAMMGCKRSSGKINTTLIMYLMVFLVWWTKVKFLAWGRRRSSASQHSL